MSPKFRGFIDGLRNNCGSIERCLFLSETSEFGANYRGKLGVIKQLLELARDTHNRKGYR